MRAPLSDVKNLNSSRHALVYNHHHQVRFDAGRDSPIEFSCRRCIQLFAAGDTISTLNAKTPQLQFIVNSLQERFDEISKLVENVSFPIERPLSSEAAEPET